MNSGADDKIYWANENESSIRVANLADGSGASVLGGAIVGGAPCGLAIDAAAGANGMIYWADFTGDAILVKSLDGTGAAATLISGEDGACGVALDPATGKIYWATYFGGAIRSSNMDGSNPQTLVSGQAGPSGVAIDPAAGKIYWTNQVDGAVRRANLDGSDPVTLVPNQAIPLGVAVDVAAGKIYWTNLGSGIFGPGAVRRANLDGSNPETLVDVGSAGGAAGVAGPAGVAIDAANGKFYWANFGGSTIWSAELSDGSNPAQLVGPGPGGVWSNFPVLLRAPQGSELPAISGQAGVGQQLTCDSGTWAPDLLAAFLFRVPHSFAYQWQLDGADIAGADGWSFTPTQPGGYTCQVTASNLAGSALQTSATFTVRPTIAISKFYDANANGKKDATDVALTGWKVQVDGIGTYLTPSTVALSPASYVVRESAATQTNWRATTATSVQVSLGAHDQAAVEFGNVCVGAGGAKTTGFWGNKNGQALFGADDLASMVALNLRAADGSNFDPASYSAFNTWLKNVTATNMAYALSAQLAGMRLNVLNGLVNGGALIYAPGTTSANAQGFATVNAVMNEANAELGAHGLTLSGSQYRTYQTRLKDALSNANSNTSFVQSKSCTFSFN